MELRILCKHLVADELDGKFTAGENSADIVRITLPRHYEQHDLSRFSFRITAVRESRNAAAQILKTDGFDEKNVRLLWEITSDFTAVSGKIVLVLTGVNSGNSAVIKFLSCPITINSDKSWEFLPSAELSEQLVNQVQLEVHKAIEAAERAEKASQTPAPAEIYPATTEKLGGVKADGKTINVSANGVISVSDSLIKTQNLAIQIAHSNNFLIYDDLGQPSVMVAVPKFYLDEVIDGASHAVHPAFIINGIEQDVIYISKYQNTVDNDRAYSLPMKDPKTNINFDQAWNYCKNKGRGWHLMTNAEWAAIALWCKKNGTLPKGNNNYGKDVSEANVPQRAIAAERESSSKISRTCTGSGGTLWNHDLTEAGIADLNGNVWEWNAGARLVDGEIQIIANNDAADWNNSVSSDSALWKAIVPDGSLAAPGTAGTLKYDWKNNKCTVTSASVEKSGASRGSTFETVAVDSGVTVSEIIKALALYPADTGGYEGDYFYMVKSGERVALHGGSWGNGSRAGVFALGLDDARMNSHSHVGFRCAYYGVSCKSI